MYDVARQAGADAVERRDVELVARAAPQVREHVLCRTRFYLQLLPVAVLALVVYDVAWKQTRHVTV